MARQRFDTAPQFNVSEDSVVIQQVAGSTAPLLELKNHTGASLMTVSNTGQMTTNASTTFTDVTISGNLTVSGNTITFDTETVVVEDKNIVLNNSMMASNSTADGGGITLSAGIGGNKTFNFVNLTSSWTSSEHIDLANNKVIKMNGVQVLSPTQYIGNANTAGTVTSSIQSNITSLGTLTGLTVNGNVTASSIIINNGSVTHNSGSNSFTTFGPNQYGAYLKTGASGSLAGANTAAVVSTDGNLHLDSGSSNAMYLNYYSGGRPINVYGAISSNSAIGTSSTINSVGGYQLNGNPIIGLRYADITGVAVTQTTTDFLLNLPAGIDYFNFVSITPISNFDNNIVWLFGWALGNWSGVQTTTQIRIRAALGNGVHLGTSTFRVYYRG